MNASNLHRNESHPNEALAARQGAQPGCSSGQLRRRSAATTLGDNEIEEVRVPDPISLTVSVLALATSVATAWLTLVRRGAVRMTQPTVVYFGPDSKSRDEKEPSPKVYLRTLLYCTSRRGRIVQSMYVKLRRGETIQTFNIWVYGEDGLSRGSGLYVGQEGVACNHHFLLPADGTNYTFLAGNYSLEIYAAIVGIRRPALLYTAELEVAEAVAGALREPGKGVYFDWGPDSARYHPHVRSSATEAPPRELLALLSAAGAPVEKEEKAEDREEVHAE